MGKDKRGRDLSGGGKEAYEGGRGKKKSIWRGSKRRA